METEAVEIRVSIIIPHYNSIDLLEKLLLSIPKEKELEIILVDDNSTEKKDRLLELVQERKDQLHFFQNEPGKNSAGRCRNIGLEHARGQWLVFADADDFFLPGFYDKIRKYFDSEYDIVWFVPTSMDLDTGGLSNRHVRYERMVREFIERKDLKSEVRLRYHQESPCSKMIRRRIVCENQIQFDTTMVANDIMFSIRCAYAAHLVEASEEKIYCVTKQEGTLTTAVNVEKFYVRLQVFLDKYHFLKSRLSKKEWQQLDLLGRPYIKLAHNYGLNKRQIINLYLSLIKSGVRIDVSRKWSVAYIWKKMKNRLSNK